MLLNYLKSLLGNKCDLESERQVLFEDACTLAEQRGALAALETSAKMDHNIEEAFILMAKELIVRSGGVVNQEPYSESPYSLLHSDSHTINLEEPLEKKPCSC